MTRKQTMLLRRLIAAAALFAGAFFCPSGLFWPRLGLYLASYLVIGYDILKKAGYGVLHGRPLDENFLMALSTVGAIALSEYPEAVAVMLFYQMGELFQSYAVGKSRRSIRALMDLRPDNVSLVGADERVQIVEPSAVALGSLIAVAPGEKIPLDGVIEKGSTTVDTSHLTGEAVPRAAGCGAAVQAGCINISGLIFVRTTCVYGEDTASCILRLLEEAASKKSKSEAFITRFARLYTPIVCALALSLAVFGPLVSRFLLHGDGSIGVFVYRALTFLVISCPCALVISIPLSFFASLGGAAKRGILIKGSGYLEALSQVKCFAFDKTGTVTRGVFEVAGVHHSPMEEASLVSLAAAAECASPHPIGAALRKACPDAGVKHSISDVRELAGRGVSAMVDGELVLVGSDRLMEESHIAYHPCRSGGTTVHVARGGLYMGHIVIADIIKSEAKEAVASLRRCGVKKAVMLSGDAESTAKAVSNAIGMDECFAPLLPSDKVRYIERLSADEGCAAFCGDGLNDAPVLMRADVGISMGVLGSDAAIEASDVVIGDDDLLKLPLAVQCGKKCMRLVRENIVLSIGVKAVCLGLSAVGFASMWAAIFADVGVMVVSVLNALRALHMPKRQKSVGNF